MHKLQFDKRYGEWFSQKVLKAIRRYSMLADGETVAVGLSGGKDSLVLLYIMAWLQKYSHLEFNLLAIHVNAFVTSKTDELQVFCDNLGVELVGETVDTASVEREKSICSLCARLKRGAMVNVCRQRGISRLAFGHHADDAAETLLMNMLINKKLGSFCPRVAIADSSVQLIRPMIYLEEQRIVRLQQHWEIQAVAGTCPYENKNRRKTFKAALQSLASITGTRNAALNMVQSLENLDQANLYSLCFGASDEP